MSFSHNVWPKFGNGGISRIGSVRFWWNSVQRKALIRNIRSREIFRKKCRQQQNFDLDPKEAWPYNHVTFTPIAKLFMLCCRLIYMLSMLYVTLTIKVKVGIPESLKVGWYPYKITGSSHLKEGSSGADPGFFFRRGCTRLLLYFNNNKPHSFFFFFAEYQLY